MNYSRPHAKHLHFEYAVIVLPHDRTHIDASTNLQSRDSLVTLQEVDAGRAWLHPPWEIGRNGDSQPLAELRNFCNYLILMLTAYPTRESFFAAPRLGQRYELAQYIDSRWLNSPRFRNRDSEPEVLATSANVE